MWLLNNAFSGADNADVGGFAQYWYELCLALGEWRDPSFVTLLLPLFSIPLISILFPNKVDDSAMSASFYEKLGRIQRNFTWA